MSERRQGQHVEETAGARPAGAIPALGLARRAGCCALVPLLVPLTLALCCCSYLAVAGGVAQKSELVWPVGVTPRSGGATMPPAARAAEVGGDPGYGAYRSVGWEITSPYGWRTYLGAELQPIPGEYEFHDGLDLAGPGLERHDPVYPLLDGQPFFVGFYPGYYEGAGEAVILWNVHSTEETPVRVLYGHLTAYRIEVETYCRRDDRYEAGIPIQVACPGEVVAERGQSGSSTGPEGKALFFNGTPGRCTARVEWPPDYQAEGPEAVDFDQQIDEAQGVACDALVRFYGCRVQPPTPTPSPTPGGAAGLSAPTVAPAAGLSAIPTGQAGIGGPGIGAGPSATPTRLPSPTPPGTATPGEPTEMPWPSATLVATLWPTGSPLPTWTAGPTGTPTRLPSPTPRTPTVPLTASPLATPWPTNVPLPTWTPGPTSVPGPTWTPWPTLPPGPTRTGGPTAPAETPFPTMSPAPRPTTVPHDCPIGQNLCYFPGFGPPITLQSRLEQGRTVLGYVGTSGRTTGPHLHLALSIWGMAQVDVLTYYRPAEEGAPVPEERLHYAARYPEWIDPLPFLPQANGEWGLAYMGQPLQLPGPQPFIPEAGEGAWYSPADVYSNGGGGRILGFDLNRLICGWFNWLCPR